VVDLELAVDAVLLAFERATDEEIEAEYQRIQKVSEDGEKASA